MQMNAEIDLVIHVGAHKTASTHFSRSVRRASISSDVKQFAVLEKSIIREKISKKISARDVSVADVDLRPSSDFRSDIVGDRSEPNIRRLLASDENIIGTPARLFRSKRMYPRAVKRVESLLRLTGRDNIRFLLCIREPASFINSAYAETVRSGMYLSPIEYLRETPLEEMRWRKLVKGLQKILKGIPLTVWTFEDYESVFDELLEMTFGDSLTEPLKINNVDRKIRVGMSQRALDIIQSECASKGASLLQERVEEIMREFPKSEEWPAPQIFSTEQRKVLAQNYRRDLNLIGKLENVNLIRSDLAKKRVREILS